MCNFIKLNIQLFASGSASKNIYAPASSTYPYTISTSFSESNSNADINNNRSTINLSASLYGKNINFSVTDGGTLYVDWYDTKTNTWTQKASQKINSTTKGTKITVSASFTATHKDDGSLSGKARVRWVESGSGTFVPASDSKKTSLIELTKIARSNIIHIPESKVGDTVNLTVAKANSSYTSTITYSFGSSTGQIGNAKDDRTIIPFTIPTSFYTQMANVKSKKCQVTCVTYNGSTQLGTSTYEFNVLVDEDTNKPTITNVSATDTVTKPSGITKLIKGFSKPNITAKLTPQNSASIANYQISCEDGQTSGVITSSATSISYTFPNPVNSKKITITATDTRGIQNIYNLELADWIEYVPLSLTAIFTHLTTSNIKINFAGTFYQGSVGDANNVLSVSYRYKKTDTTTWGGWNSISGVSPSNNVFTKEFTSTANIIDYRYSYDVELKVTDSINTTGVIVSGQIASCIPVFWWDKNSFNITENISLNLANRNLNLAGENLYDQLFYKPGDTYKNSGSLIVNGMVSNSSKSIFVNLSLPKSLKNINKITVSQASIYLRNSGGLLESSNALDATSGNYSTTCTKIDDKTVQIRIDKTSAYKNSGGSTNITNNSSVSVHFNANGLVLNFSNS